MTRKDTDDLPIIVNEALEDFHPKIEPNDIIIDYIPILIN